MTLIVRPERLGDEASIATLISAAFEGAEHSDGTEAQIVASLRAADALTISLVAEVDDVPVGYVAFSPVTIDGHEGRWFGLGPVSVAPDRQRQGVGSIFVRQGLAGIEAVGASGCVVLGDPAFYRRFGFAPDSQLSLPNVPPEYFQAFRFSNERATGVVAYHPAFDVG